MIKIENSVFEDRQYLKTLTKINNLDLHITDAYRISRLVKKLDELSTEYNELPRSKADGVLEIADTTVVPIGYGEFLCTLCLDSVHMP